MYLKFKKMTPGQMSWARSRLVNAATFGKLAVGLGLHQHILTSSANLQKAVASFAEEIKEVSLEEILHSCWKIDAPKAISDVFEAIFGAIYVDSDFNLELTFEHIHRVMANIMQYIAPDMPGDPTSELVRWVAAQGCEAQGSTIFRCEPYHIHIRLTDARALGLARVQAVGQELMTRLKRACMVASSHAKQWQLPNLRDRGQPKRLWRS
jgi:dsRNA-specific ribonuclease